VRKLKVNINTATTANPQKLDFSKQSNKKEEFKKVLDNHELQSKSSSNENLKKASRENLDKVNSDNQSADIKKPIVEDNTTRDLKNDEDNITQDLTNEEDSNKIKSEVINFIETFMDKFKQDGASLPKELVVEDKSADEMAQIQQLLQFLSSMFKSTTDATVTNGQEGDSNDVTLEQLINVEKLSTDTKDMLTNNLSEIVLLLEKIIPSTKGIEGNDLSKIATLLEKSKDNSNISSQILDVLKKITSEVSEVRGDLNLLKVTSLHTVNVNNEDKSIKDNLLKKVMEQSTKTSSEILPKDQMQNLGDSKKDSKFSGNSSFEEKFLNNLIGTDKDEVKISKAVSFMNQFESTKTMDTPKVQMPNLVIDKSNLGADIIKTIKFMEVNNTKELTVKMSPKELGEITVKITMESGIMKASISAQNKDTYNLLSGNIQDISDKLKNMDIKIQSLDINIYEDPTFFNKDSNEKNSNGRQNNASKLILGLEEEESSIINNYAIEENQVNKFV